MYSEQLERLIQVCLADGVITDKEREVICKKAKSLGVDEDEVMVYIDGLLVEMQSRKKSSKEGERHTCPNCGAVVVGGSAVCPECGYAFSNVKANSSYERLSKKLEDIDIAYRGKLSFSIPIYGVSSKVKEKASAIRMFPVPNTRADLLEFLAAMSAQIESMKEISSMQVFEESVMKKAYEAKYQECVNKARISFSNDPDFLPYLEKKKRGFSKLFGK
jgi:uncharacterized Zn finger protein (UPF0148 family)